MKKKRIYYCGYFKGQPHVANIGFDTGDMLLTELFLTKKDALQFGYEEVRKVKIVEVK